jgi:hypothetical protein
MALVRTGIGAEGDWHAVLAQIALKYLYRNLEPKLGACPRCNIILPLASVNVKIIPK